MTNKLKIECSDVDSSASSSDNFIGEIEAMRRNSARKLNVFKQVNTEFNIFSEINKHTESRLFNGGIHALEFLNEKLPTPNMNRNKSHVISMRMKLSKPNLVASDFGSLGSKTFESTDERAPSRKTGNLDFLKLEEVKERNSEQSMFGTEIDVDFVEFEDKLLPAD